VRPWSRRGKLLREIPRWVISDDAKEISRVYKFGNYYETMAFVNALAWVVHREDHHPDWRWLQPLRVRFSTHSVHGLSETISSALPRSMP